MTSIDNFSYVIERGAHAAVPRRGHVLPASTGCPSGPQALAQFNPLYHCVELVRHAVFGFEGGSTSATRRAGRLRAASMWRLAIWRMDRKLI